MAKIDEIARAAGVYIPPTKQRRRPRQTHARAALTSIAERHGDGHLLFVLRTIVESRGNEFSLWSETILAVSDIVRSRPDLADKGMAFIEAFDKICLEEVRFTAKAMRIGTKRSVMKVLILDKLEREMDDQRRLF
ncbi:hypothetical protein [Hansschlegelia plantiphila]|uniref:Uncharacterized protein n=1 Tax=Hansschlegelia plantiphila TaxID=374655 RepID=A0A9W6J1X8_9HYPH|nr:hypothetical protein [Hansschlegelia plantiphila]GLK69197.1 hypothetical protein GCM10008179_28350 [Hansschlegelia plantiphila]